MKPLLDYCLSCIQVKSITEIKSASLFVVLLSQNACVQMDRPPSGLASRAPFFQIETTFQNLAILYIRYVLSEGKHLRYTLILNAIELESSCKFELNATLVSGSRKVGINPWATNVTYIWSTHS